MKRDIDLGREGETYRGKIISRKDLNWGADSTSENGQEDESEDREGEESEDKEGENRESEEESQDESEDHMTESDESESSQVQGEDLEALEKEVDAIDEGTQLIQQIPEDEMKKAKQTRNQQILWEECMDMRIRMQKAVLSSNQFPRVRFHKTSPKMSFKLLLALETMLRFIIFCFFLFFVFFSINFGFKLFL